MVLESQRSAPHLPPRNAELGASSPEPVKGDATPSIFSNDIWLGDNSGASDLFAREVEIRGWTSVGDKLGGAYVGSCIIFSVVVTPAVRRSGLTIYV